MKKKKSPKEPAREPKKVNPKVKKQDMPEGNPVVLGEETTKVESIPEQMTQRLDRIEVGLVDLKNEFKADIAKTEDKLSKEFVGIEDKFGKKITSLEDKISRVEDRISGLESKIETKTEGLSTEIKSNLKWFVGIVVGTWITTMVALVAAILIIILK